MKRHIYFIAAVAVLSGCKPDLIAPEAHLGDIDVTTYVAIGSDGAAGYSDDALHSDGQDNSYASILASQFSLLNATDFNSPTVSASSAGINLDSNSRLVLGYKTDCNGETSLSPVRQANQGDLSILGANIYSSGFNNLGVPGTPITSINMSGYGNPANGIGNFNPYYARMASDQVNSSILSDATAQTPTFFTVDLGEADIMKYATGGGMAPQPIVANGAAGIGFDGTLDEIVSSLAINGANGAISNIPNVLDYPYFTTIPFNGLTLDADRVTTLNNVFNPLGISFVEGDNPFVIEDPAEPFGVRKMVEGELVLLSVPLDSIKCFGMGSIAGIPNKYVLTISEIQNIESARIGYNSAISAIASNHGLAMVDKASLVSSLNDGLVYNGFSMSTTFVTGGAFSLDGRNLNPNGQALLANLYIESINLTFNARIPTVNVNSYPGIIFP